MIFQPRIKQNLTAVISFILIFLVAGCGSEGGASSTTGGPVGPSNPSGYFLTYTVTPNVVVSGGTVSVKARVTDSSGAGVANQAVQFPGDSTFGTATTDANGYALGSVETEGDPGATLYETAVFEDLAVTVSYQIRM